MNKPTKPTRPTAPATSSASPAVRTGPTYRARPVRREYLCTVADEVTLRPSGFGLTLDDVIADLVGQFERDLAEGKLTVNDEGRDDPRVMDDEIVWSSGDRGSRVLAVLRPAADGSGLEVVRFDGGVSGPGRPTASVEPA